MPGVHNNIQATPKVGVPDVGRLDVKRTQERREDRLDTKKLLTAGAVACIGAALMLLGADFIPQRLFEPHVPSWVLVMLGLGLILVGVSVFFRIGSPIATRLIGVSLLLIALTFIWVAFFGDPRYMSGGLPFLPDDYNVLLGRTMFGLFALIFLLIGAAALIYAKYKPEEGADDSDI